MSKIVVGKCGSESSLSHPGYATAIPFANVEKHLLNHPKYRAPSPHCDLRPTGLSWRMLGNNKYGNCTFAAIVRQMLRNAYVRGRQLKVSDQNVIDAYLDHNNGKDVGAQPVSVFSYMRHIGIKCDDGSVLKVQAYARVDARNRIQCNSARQSFGGLYVTAGLPLALDDDRNSRLELKPQGQRTYRDEPRSMGGHAYNSFGSQRNEEFVVLWVDDMIEEIDWTFGYREEAWVFVDNQEDDPVLLDAMYKELAALKGNQP